MRTGGIARVLILGGGYGGLMAARLLQRHTDRDLEVTVVDPNTYMTYQPLLPEVAGGHVAPRDVTVPLGRTLRRCRVLQASVTGVDSGSRSVSLRAADGTESTLGYDELIVAMGAISRVFPTPGLQEHGIGFKTVEEAAFLHDHVIEQVERAAGTDDPAERAKALTFLVVGGGYTGVEGLSELADLSVKAVAQHDRLSRTDIRWVLVEALDRVAPEVGPELSRWTLGHLREKGIDVRLETTVKSVEDAVVELSTGESFAAGTVIWTAGVQPNPVLDATDLPRGPKGHLMADASLRVVREDGTPVPGVWAVGDIAQIPDLTAESQPAYYPPNAQNAMRQGPVAARNVLADLAGREPEEYRHVSLGTVASYGIGDGAANIKGVRLKGLPAWLAHRSYHLLALPTLGRKTRVLLGWIAEAVAGRELVALPAVRHPKRAFDGSFKALAAAAAKKRKSS
ncbi:NAD(P)/FAD-dependent oxidoreductase [Herbiconiux sp. VKM Ac-2851]|uniref:NAD(P)/FAD-dependent oxidoreductase n=1 Tax=Herbiconiux sp. VKM Ac-2851 TaxID=2739025 RepID=UPI0015657367|nr:FAD-dependent oxidoreductase [Herbiconiux sp. VKM Ac-2851]NQX34102.1 FAD-dependent oxidoreductase [Herbiconiux sp. VKM Ac-2851]